VHMPLFAVKPNCVISLFYRPINLSERRC